MLRRSHAADRRRGQRAARLHASGAQVIETRRGKYACKLHEEAGVLTPPVPIHPIAKGMATSGLIANVLVAKYKDHLPLYRQSDIFARHRAEIAESTLGDWVKDAAELLQPVVTAMRASVLASHVVHGDETRITVLDKESQKGSRPGYLWVYIGNRVEVVFDFTPGRGREGPRRFRAGYSGYLQVDAYAGYDAARLSEGMIEAGCWAHARRRFFDALESEPKHAGSALEIIRRLYAVERQAKHDKLDADSRRNLRQHDESRCSTRCVRGSMHCEQRSCPRVRWAMRSGMRQWEPLTRYLDDGRIEIDNNRA